MIHFKITTIALVGYIVFVSFCLSAPFLDGTSLLVYKTANQVFRATGGSQSKVQGFVRLGGGFTVLPNASVIFDSPITVSGAIDLRETGTLILNRDLSLDSNLVWSSGGNISGQNNTIFLGGSLTIPSSKVVHIQTSTIIDGQGQALIVGDYGQIFVDNNVTLTLQNMILRSGQKTAVFSPIRCAGLTSQLVLDNVIIESQGDIPFYQGKMYIYDNVVFTGTSSLVYTSPQSIFIKSGAAFYFDKTTTFSFAPSTASNNQVVMSDATSKIILDGATLKCTDTGIRLTVGMLLCDNKVSLDSLNGYSLSSMTTVTYGYFVGGYVGSGNVMRIRWHPSGNYFSCSGDTSAGSVKVYAFNPKTNTTTFICKNSPGPANFYSYAHDWSPDGRFLAVTFYVSTTNSGSVSVYSFNGTSLTLVKTITLSYSPYSVAWSPDGRYLALGGDGTAPSLNIATFDGISLTVVTTVNVNKRIPNLAWGPSGGYLATVNYDGYTPVLYAFDGINLTAVGTTSFGSYAMATDMSPDGKYATATSAGGNVLVYNVPAYGGNIGSWPYGATTRSSKWSPDSKMLAATGDQNLVKILLFTGSSNKLQFSCTMPNSPTSLMDCAWHSTGKYLAVIGKDGTNFYYYIIGLGYTVSSYQAVGNSIVFGNSNLASSSNNLKVKVLSGARVEARGKILDDSY